MNIKFVMVIERNNCLFKFYIDEGLVSKEYKTTVQPKDKTKIGLRKKLDIRGSSHSVVGTTFHSTVCLAALHF